MRELCEAHKLVLGPDGKCVLCRRPKQPLFAVREETESMISKVFTWFLGACLIAAASALVYSWRLDKGYQGARYVEVPGGPAPSRAKPRKAATPPATTATPQKQALADAERAAKSAAAAKTNKPGTTGPLAVDAPKIPVTMYATPWCFICDRARDFLSARNVTLTEYDIERDRAATKRLAKINPAVSVPTFEVGGKTYIGFNPWQLEDAIHNATAQQFSARAP